MLIAMHSKEEENVKRGKSKYALARAVKGDIDIMGIALPCIIVEGKFFFNVIEYVDKCYKHKAAKLNAAASWYYQWRSRYSERVDGMGGGIVVAIPSGYYGDLEYLQTVTKALDIVSEGNSKFVADVSDKYAEAVIAIYRGIAIIPTVTDSKAGFTWDDFYEVDHQTLVSTPTKSSKEAGGVNVPVKAPHFVGVRNGIQYPEHEDDMPEVITRNHPVTTEDTIKETEFAVPLNDELPIQVTREVTMDSSQDYVAVADTTEVNSSPTPEVNKEEKENKVEITDLLGGLGAVLGQLVGGKKIKLTVTLELE